MNIELIEKSNYGATMYYTEKQKKFHLRCNGSYATYPIMLNGVKEYNLECYSKEVDFWINKLNNGYTGKPFAKI